MSWTHRAADWMEDRWSEVWLPPGLRPVFPPVCIGCGAPPQGEVTIASRGSSSLAMVFGSFSERLRRLRRPKYAVQAPACASCAPQIAWRHRWRRRFYWLPLQIGAALHVFALFTERWWSGYPIVVALGVSLVWVGYEVLFPEALGLTETDEEVRCEFGSRRIAVRFAEANEAEVR